jgi:hypothetical protein
LRRFEEAEALCREALQQSPDDAETCRTLGNLFYAQRRLDETRRCYDAALERHPDDAGTRWNRAMLLLLQGQFVEGWKEYEWRWRRPDARPRHFPQPAWDGQAIEGRRILIYSEQGLGDSIQFLRYLPMVEQAGGRVIFECHARLAKLLAGTPGMGEVIAGGVPLPEFDVHAPLLSLPRLFGTTLETLPSAVPYLAAPAAPVEAWRGRLAKMPSLRIGLAWAGNPRNPDDSNRSIPPSELEPLTRLPGVSWINLQKDAGPADLPIHFLGGCDDVTDTAALIANLDLVVSADTMVAHLAGALARPVWTLLPFAADWRWLLDREDSPWYPTMRLFRQPGPGRWKAVIEAVRNAISG